MACSVCNGPLSESGDCARCEPTPSLKGPAAERSAEPTLVGKLVAGRYRIEERIAGGGMGEIYRAEDTRLGKRVAIKRLMDFWRGDAQVLARFHAEMKNTARVDHPNVVEILDKGEDEAGRPFFVLELLSGRTLSNLLKAEGKVPFERAVRIFDQILRGLSRAHQLRVIHRDLKPANIMLVEDGSEDGLVKILDFGIAKALDSATAEVTQQGMFMGTPAFMAPEVVTGRGNAHPTVDVYAVGVMLFEMLAGTLPWPAPTDGPIVAPQAAGTPQPRVRERCPEVPEWLDAVVARAMAPSPHDRFQTAEELRAALLGTKAAGQIAVGTVVDDAYRVERVIWQGDLATVCEAVDLRIGRRCAVKVLARLEGGDHTSILTKRFFQDAALAAKIEHPNVVRVFGAGEWQGVPYIAMELVEGQTLEARLPALPWPAVLAIVRQVASALDAVHAAGIVHRDISLNNVLIDRNGVAKLLDFSVARACVSTLTSSQVCEAIGRYGFKAPEQAWDPRTVTPLSDQWSLAAVVYGIVSGHLPYCEPEEGEGTDAEQEIAARLVAGAPPRDPREWNSSVPAGLAAVIMRALAFEPSRRYPSLQDFVKALSSTRASGLTLPFLADGIEAVPRPRRRLAWVLASVAASALTVAAIAYRPQGQPSSTPSARAEAPPATMTATMTIESTPADAILSIDGQRLVLPATLERPLGTRVSARVEKDGFEPRDVMLDFSAPAQRQPITLMPRPAPPPEPRKRSRPASPPADDSPMYLEPTKSDSVVVDPR